MLKIYKASAGSGKTYTLAYEYIRDLLGVKIPGTEQYCLNSPKYNKSYAPSNNRHRFILAITFTNKATEEMKRRIIEKLDALSRIPGPGDDEADYAKDLCVLFGCSRPELADVAKKSLRQLLYYYSFFNVATIDSFFQRVLRTFARELDRQGDFNVEISDTLAVQTAIDTMLNEFNRSSDLSSPLGKWIFSYISTEFESGNKTNMFNRRSSLYGALLHILKRVCDETFKPYEQKMLDYLEDRVAGGPNGSDNTDLPQEHRFTHKKVDATIKALHAKREQILEDISHRVSTQMAELQKDGVEIGQLNSRLSLVKLIPDYFIPKKKVEWKTINRSVVPIAFERKNCFTKSRFKGTQMHVDLFIDMIEDVVYMYYDYYGLETLISSVRELGLLAYAWQYLKEFSAVNNTVLLSDTNQILSRIIGKDPTPFIYERMGVTLNHFLIDEFQDTSKMQWANLKPLVDNSLGEGHDNLIIGDEKQSIYRFRNSDSTLLRTTVQDEDFPTPRYHTQVCGAGKADNTNWRSASDVVKFNNTLFTNLAANLHAEGFENVVQAIASKNKDRRGYVEFVVIDPKEAPENDDDTEQKGDTSNSDNEKMMSMAINAMAQKMLHQHSDLGYDWKDMVVLVNRNEEGAAVVETLLKDYPQIPVLSEESLYLKKSPAVQLIVDVLRLIAVPEGEASERTMLSAAEVARVLSRIEYFRAQGADLTTALDKSLDLEGCSAQNLRVGIDAIKARKPASLISLIESIILEQISPAERQSQIAYLTAFLDHVADYCSKFNPTMAAFLNHWDAVSDKLSISSASDIDAVKVMTIHKSKGLEFECVHIPFGWWKLIDGFRGQWLEFPKIEGVDAQVCPPVVFIEMNNFFSHEGSFFAKQYAEDSYKNMIDTLNKTYVAFTRASSQLIVYYNNGKEIGSDIADAMADGYKGTNENMDDISKYYTLGSGAFVMGEDCPKKKDKPQPKKETDETESPVVLQHYPVYYTEGAEMITCVADVLDFTPETEPVDDEEDLEIENYAPESDEKARLRGIRLHDALSRIEVFGDLERAVSECAQYLRLDADERTELRTTLSEILNPDDELLRRWFEENECVTCEQSIYIPSTGKTRRLDRMVVYADGSVDIIDYKFTAETDKSHNRQVQSYMRLLQKMGYKHISGYLWYPMKKYVVKVKSVKCEV